MTRAYLLAPALLFLIYCSDADTLGDEPPVEVGIQGSLVYDNGVDELLRVKCGYCHAYPKPELAPDNILEDLDLTVYATRLVDGKVIRGADSVGAWIREGILDDPVNTFDATSNPRQMPLDYGTPVTAGEKRDLEDWADLGSPKDESPQPSGNADQGAAFYQGICANCHASDGSGVGFDGIWIGPPLEPATVTVEKIESMWLHKAYNEDFQVLLEDGDAADIRAYILEIVLNRKNGSPQ